jgi:nucleoside-diphosphate-sugar epimerase
VRYLVTGGAGFIGSHLVDAIVQRGDSVLVLDDLSTGRLANLEHLEAAEAVEVVEGSVTDPDAVEAAVSRCDAVFHLAAAVGVKLIIAQPLDSLLRNVRGTDTVIEAAARHQRPYLFTSSSEVYGKINDGAVGEEADRILGSPLKTRWAYANAKSLGEALAHAYHRERGFPMVVARVFNCVGPRQTGAYGMVLPRFVNQALEGNDLTVYGNGTQTRTFGHVTDTVDALLRLMDSDEAKGGVYNVGGTEEIAVIELARRVIERTGSSSTVRLIPYEEAYEEGFEELGRRLPDTTALRELTGWRPTRTVEDAIDDIAAFAGTRQRGSAAIVD